MNKLIGISIALSLIPLYTYAQNSLSTTGIIVFYGLLPISIFITALILSMNYAYRDARDDKPGVRVAGWIFCILNACVGTFWLYSTLLEIYHGITGETEFRISAMFFLLAFIFGGFHPLYIMYKAEFK